MFGGPPIMMSGQPYFQTMPARGSPPWQPPMAFPPPRFEGQALSNPSPRQPVLAEMASGISVPEVPPAAAPRIRMQAPDEPSPRVARPLAIPSPDELGISPPAPPGKVDWNNTQNLLHQLGVRSFRVDRAEQEAIRVTFLVMKDASGRPRQIESTASTEAEALAGAIQETRLWVREP